MSEHVLQRTSTERPHRRCTCGFYTAPSFLLLMLGGCARLQHHAAAATPHARYYRRLTIAIAATAPIAATSKWLASVWRHIFLPVVGSWDGRPLLRWLLALASAAAVFGTGNFACSPTLSGQ